jgi:hypothetical protein
MSKAEYIDMRKKGSYNLNWFYQYYIKNIDRSEDKNVLPLQIFQQVFGIYLQACGKDIFAKLDAEFDISYIEDKNGKIIYIK